MNTVTIQSVHTFTFEGEKGEFAAHLKFRLLIKYNAVQKNGGYMYEGVVLIHQR